MADEYRIDSIGLAFESAIQDKAAQQGSSRRARRSWPSWPSRRSSGKWTTAAAITSSLELPLPPAGAV